MAIAFAIVLVATGAVVALLGLYQLVLAAAAFRYRASSRPGSPETRVTVLVPAHDEEALIARTVRSLLAQSYPRALYDVVVIADNCSDRTAERAHAAGADVLVRDEPAARGKGQALRWAIDRVLASASPPDAVAVVDADTVAAPDFLELLVRPVDAGARASQGESLLFGTGSRSAALRAAAFLLVNRVRPAGRAVLGLPCTLQGNGMLVTTDVLREHPWNAFSATEDLEYSIELRLAGVRPEFAAGAILESPSAPTAEAATQQQLRWEGGKVHVARRRIPQLLAAAVLRGDASLAEAALDLAVPPLGLLAGTAAAGTVGCAIAIPFGLPLWSIAPWIVADVAIPAYVLLGFRAGHAPASAYRALAQAPALMLQKLARAHRLLTFRADSWVRTERGEGRGDVR